MFNDAALFALEVLHRLVAIPESKQYFADRRAAQCTDEEFYFDLLDWAEACTSYFQEHGYGAPMELDIGREAALLILESTHLQLHALADEEVFLRLVPLEELDFVEEPDDVEDVLA